MATMWRKAMLYLGLGPDEEYDDYDPGYDDPAPAPGHRQSAQATPAYHEPEPHQQNSAVGAVRPMNPVRHDPAPSDFASQVGAGMGSSSGMGSMGGIGAVTPSGGMGGARPRPKVVRPMPVASTARPRVVVPTSFNQAQTLADTFKGGQPVVMNLRQADREVSRRLIDFSSGLCYGLGGRMEKLDGQVYLVMPTSVEVTEDERDRLRDRNYED